MKSYLVSLGAGYGFCFILFALQHPLYLLARKLRPTHWLLEHGLEVFVKILATGASVLLWRGGWGLCRDFLLKEEWQFWLAHSCGIGFLVIVQASATIGIPSIAIDCEFGWGTGQYYPVEFFLQWYYRRIYRKVPMQVRSTRVGNDVLTRVCLHTTRGVLTLDRVYLPLMGWYLA